MPRPTSGIIRFCGVVDSPRFFDLLSRYRGCGRDELPTLDLSAVTVLTSAAVRGLEQLADRCTGLDLVLVPGPALDTLQRLWPRTVLRVGETRYVLW